MHASEFDECRTGPDADGGDFFLGGNVDPGAGDLARIQTLYALITSVVNDLDDADPGDNKKKFMLHLAWHEGAKITKREQDLGGPARSFYQLEREKAIDAVSFAKDNAWVDKLSAAAGDGTTSQQILDALADMQNDPTNPVFPDNNAVARLLDTVDLFGTYMARIALKRISDPIGTSTGDHAQYWADHWKIKFDSDSDKAAQIATFTTEADACDKIQSGG